MIVNEPAIDYLTLTTRSRQVADELLRVMDVCSIEPAEESRRMQYDGLRKGSIFLGSAIQGDSLHWLFQASGMTAQLAYNAASHLPPKCTRLDIQITVQPQANYHHRSVYEAIRQAKMGPQVSIIESGDGLDTIYVGRRSSRRFARLYLKVDDKGQRWLRFEMEYKAELAEAVHKELLSVKDDSKVMAEILLGELQFTPLLRALLHPVWDRLKLYADEGKQPSDGRVATSGRTLRWLQQQVNPALMRAMYDPDEGEAIKALVRAWAAEADMLDDSLDTLGV